MNKIKSEDEVIVIAGKDKGKRGNVLSVVTEAGRVFVEGINVTESDRSGHRRAEQAKFFASAGNARYAAGARFSF